MINPENKAIRKWMSENCHDFIDECNELNCTGLAESCFNELCPEDDEGPIPDEFFEIALEFVE